MSAPRDVPPAQAAPEGPALLLAQVMLDALGTPAQMEIERALRLTLFEPPSIMERRRDELHCLARMLDAEAHRLGLVAPGLRRRFGAPLDDTELDAFVRQPYPHVPAMAYDLRRGPDDPDSRELTARFRNSWSTACRAVWGLMADGRYAGHSVPWINAVHGQPRIRYTDEECIAALRACAHRFARIPSVTLYKNWLTRRNAHARRIGRELPRLPNYQSFHSRWGGWPRAIEVAELDALELVTQPPREPTWAALASKSDEPESLGEQEASAAAVGELTPDTVRRARLDRGISEGALRAAAGMTLSEWRRFMRGELALNEAAAAAVTGGLA